MGSEYSPFQSAPVSPLPEGVPIKHVLDSTGEGKYDLSQLDTRPTTSMRLARLFCLLAFVVGVTAVVFFGYLVWVGRAPFGSDEFSALFQVNSYAYCAAALGLSVFRLNAKAPVELDVAPSGLTFRSGSGRQIWVPWQGLAGETAIYDATLLPSRPVRRDVELTLYTLPKYYAARSLVFLPPSVPRTYLTRAAFEGVLEGAKRAGLTVTRFGERYVLEQLNPMKFPPRY